MIVVAELVEEAFDWFVWWFAAEDEGLVVDRHDAFGVGPIGQLDGLFGGAVVGDPGVVSADGHDGEVDGFCGAEFLELRCVSSVAGEEDFVIPCLDEIAVVAAIGVVADAGSPMFDFDGADVCRADLSAFAPAEFFDGLPEARVQEILGFPCADDGDVCVCESLE